MYCLKIEKINKENKSSSINLEKVESVEYLSFENFKDLYFEKQRFDRKRSKIYKYDTTVYKISNEGKRVEQLTDTNSYDLVSNIDRELKDSLTSYSYLKQVFDKMGVKFSVGKSNGITGNVLIVRVGSDKLEIEKVKMTPKYEIRKCVGKNGKGRELLFCETAQNEIISTLKVMYGLG